MSTILTCFALILASNNNGQTTVLSGYPTQEAAQDAADASEVKPYPCAGGICVGLQRNFRDIRIIPAPLKDCAPPEKALFVQMPNTWRPSVVDGGVPYLSLGTQYACGDIAGEWMENGECKMHFNKPYWTKP